jgi:hypothetical protein
MLLLMSETTRDAEGDAPEPLIRVVRGVPTPEEVAALVGVLVKHARPPAAAQPRPVSLWAASARPAPARSQRSWRAGALPGIRGL